MDLYVVQNSFTGSPFTLAAVCPSGARVSPFHVSKEGADRIAATLSDVTGESWEAVEFTG